MLAKKILYTLVAFCLLASGLVAFGFAGNGQSAFLKARKEVLIRKIGDELLRKAGDSSTRVPPVKQIGEDAYQLRFETGLTFQTDSLVKIVGNVLTGAYNVSIISCNAGQVVYGYSILGSAKEDVVPCSGREQPRDCYIVEIIFKSDGVTEVQKGYLLGSVPLIALVGFLWLRGQRKSVIKEGLNLGNTTFYLAKNMAIVNNVQVEFTAKETSVLKILAQTPGQMIPRSRLQKEIWEDEGVIVGRSLDMFISKLRKKLAADNAVEIKNIHGKGYILQVSL